MATVKINLSQKTINDMSTVSDGAPLTLDLMLQTAITANSELSAAYYYANNYTTKTNSVKFTYGDGTTSTIVGASQVSGYYSYVTDPLTGNQYYFDQYGTAVATSKVLNIPGGFSEKITGTLYYYWGLSGGYLSYRSDVSVIDKYELVVPSDQDFGTITYSVKGSVGIGFNSSGQYSPGTVSGQVSSFQLKATKLLKQFDVAGNFGLSGTTDNPVISGTATSLKQVFTDNSLLEFSGSLTLSGAQSIGDSLAADESLWSGNDDFNISLPSLLTEDMNIRTGSGNDTITAKGGGGRLLIDAGEDDDEITLLDSSPMINGGDGDDTVKSSAISLDLRNYTSIEKITLLGKKALNATGNSDVNVLRGNSAANVLDSQGGADTLEGGAGNDTYVVYGNGETITDTAGTDLIRSYATWTLSAGLENLTLMGSDNIDGVGNTGSNNITGNSANNVLSGDAGNDALVGGAGNDTLDGGAGADKMTGGTGDDVYIVDNTKDVVTEKANEGTDTIETSLSSLSIAKLSAIENLTYTGLSNATLVGNALSNILTGSAGNDRLDGGRSTDVMIGGFGDDTYIVDNAADSIQEDLNMGTDSVLSSVTFRLSDNVENLTLSGRSMIHGTGNELDNRITGNTAANTLSGEAGNDILDGGAGNDTLLGGDGDDLLIGGLGNDLLTGGDGADKFGFDKALGRTNIDTITDFLTGVDSLELDDAIFKKFIGDSDLSDNFVSGGAGVRALDSNDHLIFNTDTGALFYDPDGSGRGAMLQFATLTGVSDLSYTDFWIV